MPTAISAAAANAPAIEASPELDLDARMALTEAEMAARLDTAAIGFEVNTAHLATESTNLADVVRLPVAAPLPPLRPYPTPVAALLQRAARRLEAGGWCGGAWTDGTGAHCLAAAIRAEAPTGELEAAAMSITLAAIRRHHPAADRVQAWNDAQTDSRLPLRRVAEAAELANARNL